MGWLVHRQEGAKREGLAGRSPGKDAGARCLLCSLPTKLVLGSAWKAASGKAVTPGAMAGGNPGGLSPQRLHGLLPFHANTFLHLCGKGREAEEINWGRKVRETSIPVSTLPPTCLVTLDPSFQASVSSPDGRQDGMR